MRPHTVLLAFAAGAAPVGSSARGASFDGAKRMRTIGLWAVAAAAMLASMSARAGDLPARVAPVTTTLYGDTYVDNYRWMEKVDPEFVSWIKTEDTLTRSELQALPGYPKLLANVTRAVEAEVAVGLPLRVGDRLYYRERGAGEAQFSLYVRHTTGGAKRKLVDPVALRGATTAISDWAVSPDNRWLIGGGVPPHPRPGDRPHPGRGDRPRPLRGPELVGGWNGALLQSTESGGRWS
jgi:hypothetical protein